MTGHAVIVAHGQPGDPGPQQLAIEALAGKVAALGPGLTVAGATLAAPGALAAALRPGCLVYPMFMAEGWFTGRELPRRLRETGIECRVLRPFGTDPALPDLCILKARQAAQEQHWAPDQATVLLAAHGSQRSQSSYQGNEAMAAKLAPHFKRVVTGYVEQDPFLADAGKGLEQALCLPFFATRAEHVTDDLPQALASAGFAGPLLDPIGTAPEAPALIAAALRQQGSRA